MFCTGCGAPVNRDDLPRRPEQKTDAGKTKNKQKTQKKKAAGKAWLIPVIIALVLALGAGAYFMFFRSSGKVDLNQYLVTSLSGQNDNYSVRVGLNAAGLIRDNKKAFAVTDSNRAKIKQYLLKTFPSLMMESMVELAVQTETAASALSGEALTADEALAELALVAAVADRTAIGGSRIGPQNLPEVKTGSLDKKSGRSKGDRIRFTWGEIDAQSMKSLFGVSLTCSDITFVLGQEGGTASASVPAPAASAATEAPTTPEPVTEAPATPAPTTPEPVTEAPATLAPTTPEPATEAPTTPAPTTPEPTTEAPATTAEATTEAPTAIVSTTEAPPPTEAPVAVRTGDIVTYGTYEQDGNFGNGAEPIEWVVFTYDDDHVWLLSRYILDTQPYHTRSTSIDYESSSVNRWLNSAFLNTAFTAAEQGMLETMWADAALNPYHRGTRQGGDVSAKVALLSLEEITEYFPAPQKRLAQGTAYTHQYTKLFVADNGNSPWWTRTLGDSTAHATLTRSDGSFNYDGRDLTIEEFGIRPCICLPREMLR